MSETAKPANPLGLGMPPIHPTIPSILPEKQSTSFWSSNPVLSYVNDVYNSIATHRSSLNLINPGTVEDLDKEVSKDVFVNSIFFEGLKADFMKIVNMNPMFQVTQSFTSGSKTTPPFSFTPVFQSDKLIAVASTDNDLSKFGRLIYTWDKNNVTKILFQQMKGQPSMLQLEQDYQGNDFSINVKMANPSFLQGGFSGVVSGSLLQALTPRFALGLEATLQAINPMYPREAMVSYLARYNAGNWIFSGQLSGNGGLTASFWRKVSDKVEVGLESQITASVVPIQSPYGIIGYTPKVDGKTTIGAKYEFVNSVFRGQLDSEGKVACVLEKRVLPVVSVLFSGEIDQFKNTSRVGIGCQIQSSTEAAMAQQQQMQEAGIAGF